MTSFSRVLVRSGVWMNRMVVVLGEVDERRALEGRVQCKRGRGQGVIVVHSRVISQSHAAPEAMKAKHVKVYGTIS